MPKPPLELLKKRSDFLLVTKLGEKQYTPAFIIQILRRPQNGPIRYGLTASRKVGNAVERNQAKRRLRALVQHALPQAGMSGATYVFIARRDILRRNFSLMEQELEKALIKFHPRT